MLQQCLICGDSFACDKAANNLEAQINVVFLLQNILGVPSSKCVEFLENFGSPSKWINLCPQRCQPLLSKALEAHKQISKLSHKLGVIKGQVLDGIRRPTKTKTKRRGQSAGLIEAELREFVAKQSKIDETEGLEVPPSAEIDIKMEQEEEEPTVEAFDSWEIDPELANEQEEENGETNKFEDEMEFLEEGGSEWEDDRNWDNSDSEFNAEQDPDDSDYDEKPKRGRTIPAISSDFSENMKLTTDGNFSCSLCPKIFGIRNSLRKHQNLVHGLYFRKNEPLKIKEKVPRPPAAATEEQLPNGELRCLLCPKSYAKRKNLKSHQRLVHKLITQPILDWRELVVDPTNETSFACSVCAKSFDTKRKIRRHARAVHGVTPTPKPLSLPTQDDDMAMKVEAEDEEEESNECLKCGETFSGPLASRNHKSALHSETIKDTSKKTKRVDYLQLVKDVELTPWKCCECLRWFSDEGLRDEHQRAQHDKHVSEQDLAFACDRCESRRYLSAAELCLHKELAHGGSGLEESEAKFACATCSSRFGDSSRLEFHLGHVHGLMTNPKKAKVGGICPICGLACFHLNYLSNHVAVHRGQRRYLCELCSATFTASRYLEVHKIRVHGDSEPEKNPLGCGPCNRIFSTKTYLAHHMAMVHEKKYKYICDICGAGRNHLSSFSQHMLSHGEARGYGCKLCGAKYKIASALTKHIVVKHSGKKIPCKLCGKEFRAKTD